MDTNGHYRKAIFIDWQNLKHMNRALGIGKTNFDGLNSLFSEIDNSETQIGHGFPMVVAVERDRGLKKTFESADWHPIFVEGGREKDDRAINEAIRQLDPDHFNQIVIVSSDIRDYLDNLREKQSQGVNVSIVCTEEKGNRGYSMMARGLKEQLEVEGFSLIELADHKDRIMGEAWTDVEKPTEERTKVTAGKSIKVMIEFDPNSRRKFYFLKDLAGLLEKYERETVFIIEN